MNTAPRSAIRRSICTVLDFVDLNPAEVARILDKREESVKRAIDALVLSGHLIPSPLTGFAYRNSGHWNPDAAAYESGFSGPDSPKRRHDDYRDPDSPFYEKSDDWLAGHLDGVVRFDP